MRRIRARSAITEIVARLTPTRSATSDWRRWSTSPAAGVLPEADVDGVRGTPQEILEILDDRRPDVVFNLCEAPLGRPDLEAHVAALFEWYAVRFTGSGSETLAICRRKDRTKSVLIAADVPVPREGVFPCIVKPLDEDGSAGIDSD